MRGWVLPNGMSCPPNFVNVGQMITKFTRHTHPRRQLGDLKPCAVSLRKHQVQNLLFVWSISIPGFISCGIDRPSVIPVKRTLNSSRRAGNRNKRICTHKELAVGKIWRWSSTNPFFDAQFAFIGVGVLLAADSQSTSSSGYRASLWDPWPDFIFLFFFFWQLLYSSF
jgi:hypothetical protein